MKSSCAGDLTSALLLPYVSDGDGTLAGIRNERTALILDNAIGGAPLSATCLLFGANGTVDSTGTFSLAAPVAGSAASATLSSRSFCHSTAPPRR